MSDAAAALLGDFLDRIERRPERSRRVTARPPSFASLAEREAFEAVLRDAERAGCIEVEHDRRARHLIERIVLRDPAPLYAFLGRTPFAAKLAAARDAVRTAAAAMRPDTVTAAEDIVQGWAEHRQPYGFPLGDPAAAAFLRVLDAVLGRPRDDRSDLRTFSRRALGNSKAVEEHRTALVGFFRRSGRLPDDVDDADALALLGLEKFQHPVLIAGPALAAGLDCSAHPYLGLPPEALDGLRPGMAVSSVLTIENLASFNRHVREVRRPADVVIYTGGFPSRATLQAIRTIVSWRPDRTYHWGDIDPGGVRIAVHLARSTGIDLRPHLMSPEVAMALGTAPSQPARSIDAAGTAFEDIAAFLASDRARHLEQEELDPRAPG